MLLLGLLLLLRLLLLRLLLGVVTGRILRGVSLNLAGWSAMARWRATGCDRRRISAATVMNSLIGSISWSSMVIFGQLENEYSAAIETKTNKQKDQFHARFSSKRQCRNSAWEMPVPSNPLGWTNNHPVIN